ncbi:MAG: serine/threonine protein kinase, partial [Planctomycetales bacterium]|nr:serine/threonine protein kinase [Planctomycetales bacterium]
HEITNDLVQRFVNEAQITGQLEHPGIVPVYEIGVDQNLLPFYTMKQVRGETLAHRIKTLHANQSQQEFQILLRQLLDRFRDVCHTVAYAHRSQVIHRDLKPANIMVGEFGETILLDWGLARREAVQPEQPEACANATLQAGVPGSDANALSTKPEVNVRSKFSRNSSRSDMTRQGTVMGTASYMSPEQALGENDRVSKRSDVFSLGVILYEILAGQLPFQSDTLEGTLRRVVLCDYRPLREVSPRIPRSLAAICEYAMQREPGNRYPDAHQMAQDLDNFLAGGLVSVYSESAWERFDRLANRHSTAFRAIFATCLLVTATALFAVGKVSQAHQQERIARLAADSASASAKLALQNESLARQRTAEQLVASREAADSWLIDISGDLQFYPGLQPVRQMLLERGVQHYQNLLDTTKHDQEVLLGESVKNGDVAASRQSLNDQRQIQSEIVNHLLRLGDLQRLLGRPDESRQNYQQAQSLAEACLSANEGDATQSQAEATVQLANAFIGQAILGQENLGNLPAIDLETVAAVVDKQAESPIESQGTIDRAIAMTQQLLQQDPTNRDARNALTRARVVAARIAACRSDWESAERYLTDALPDSEILLQQSPSPGHVKLRGTIIEEKTRVLFRSGQYVKAAQAARDLIAFYDRSLDESPARPDLFESRSLAASLLASSMLAESRMKSALESYRDAENDLDRAWHLLYGESFYRENRAVLLANLADTFTISGRNQEAIEALHSAVDEWQQLVETEGVSPDRVYRLACCYLSLAQLFTEQQSDEAKQWLELNDVLVPHLLELKYPKAASLALAHIIAKAENFCVSGNDSQVLDQLASFKESVAPFQGSLNDSQLQWLQGKAQFLEANLSGNSTSADQAALLAQALDNIESAARSGAYRISYQANRFLLKALCESHPDLINDASRAQRVVRAWVTSCPESPEAWHWCALVQYMQEDVQSAQASIQKALQLRASEATVEDELLLATIAHKLNSASSARLLQSAVARAELIEQKSSHLEFLLSLVSNQK